MQDENIFKDNNLSDVILRSNHWKVVKQSSTYMETHTFISTKDYFSFYMQSEAEISGYEEWISGLVIKADVNMLNVA